MIGSRNSHTALVSLAIIKAFVTYIVEERQFSPTTGDCYAADLAQMFGIQSEHFRIAKDGDETDAYRALLARASGSAEPLPALSLTVAVVDTSIVDLLHYVRVIKDAAFDYKVATVARKIAAVRSFYKWAFKTHLREDNPAESIPTVPRSIRQISHVDAGNIPKLMNTPSRDDPLSARDRVIFAILYDTGIRTGELVALNNEDVSGNVLVVGKSNRQRTCTVSDNTLDELRNYRMRVGYELKPEAPLLLNKHGTRLAQRSLRRKFDKYVRQAELVGVLTPRDLRRNRLIADLAGGKSVHAVSTAQGLKRASFLTQPIRKAVSQRRQELSSAPAPDPITAATTAEGPPTQPQPRYGRATPIPSRPE